MTQDAAMIFEIDRSNMVVHLRGLQRDIDQGAEELEMVGAERVFGESLSRALVEVAGKLRATARTLTGLLRSVERAPIPKGTGVADRKSPRRSSRKTRN